MIGLTMRSVTWNQFPIKNLRLIPCLFHAWSEVTRIQMCTSLNHRKKMKALPSRLIPRKPTENLELLFYCKRVAKLKHCILRGERHGIIPLDAPQFAASFSTKFFCRCRTLFAASAYDSLPDFAAYPLNWQHCLQVHHIRALSRTLGSESDASAYRSKCIVFFATK